MLTIIAFIIALNTEPLQEVCYKITWTQCNQSGCNIQYKKGKEYKRIKTSEKNIRVYDLHCEYKLKERG
jgi:hypothetical protein